MVPVSASDPDLAQFYKTKKIAPNLAFLLEEQLISQKVGLLFLIFLLLFLLFMLHPDSNLVREPQCIPVAVPLGKSYGSVGSGFGSITKVSLIEHQTFFCSSFVA